MFHWPESFSSTEQFEDARKQLAEIYLRCLGEIPERLELDPKVLETRQKDGYRRELIEYAVEKDEPRVRGYVFIPDKIKPGSPSIVCLHQHGGQFSLGKSEQAARIGSPHQNQAVELAQRGYVTITADARCFEERMKYWDGDGIYGTSLLIKGATLPGRNVWDIQRKIDYFVSRPEVNPDLLGVVGHSMGSMHTTILLPLEPRIKVAVASQGVKLYSGMLERGDGFPQAYILPGFYKYADLDALLASFAPKPLLLTGREQDSVSKLDDQLEMERRLTAVYDLFGAKENFKYVREPGGHQFSPALRAAAYDWFDRHLKA